MGLSLDEQVNPSSLGDLDGGISIQLLVQYLEFSVHPHFMGYHHHKPINQALV